MPVAFRSKGVYTVHKRPLFLRFSVEPALLSYRNERLFSIRSASEGDVVRYCRNHADSLDSHESFRNSVPKGTTMIQDDFRIETSLHTLDPQLHWRFQNIVCSIPTILSRYQQYFPEYTDHTELHTMTVIDNCNMLIGRNVRYLNADELFVLLISCYMHDIGMGIPQQEYEEFLAQIDVGDFFETHDRTDMAGAIREFHNEFSGCFVRKYANLFDLPSEEHTYAVIQICRGHRRTDLFDADEYPQRLALPNGNGICLPYLAAILRLADELDVSAVRNPILLYDINSIRDKKQLFEHKRHKAIRRVEITEDAFILYVNAPENQIHDSILTLAGKVQSTLDLCVEVIRKKTPYEITQRQVLIKEV